MNKFRKSDEITWDEVMRRHRTASAVRLKGGEVQSVLCGSEDHADVIGEEHVLYRIPRKTFYVKTIEALMAALAARTPFTVFRKLGKNRWRDLGKFVVCDAMQCESFATFRLMPLELNVQLRGGHAGKRSATQVS